MANDLTTNPLVVDTAAATVLWTDYFKPKSVRWVGATTAGHAAEIQDQNGKVMYRAVADGANFIDDALIEREDPGWNGFKVPTLDSGKLYITYC
jgi:hypothetical protein